MRNCRVQPLKAPRVMKACKKPGFVPTIPTDPINFWRILRQNAGMRARKPYGGLLCLSDTINLSLSLANRGVITPRSTSLTSHSNSQI
jgi:hypothetical protein